MRTLLVVVLLFAALVVVPVAIQAQSTDLTAEERAALTKQLAEIERQIRETESTIITLNGQGVSLKRDIAILDGEIKKAKLEVRGAEIEVQRLDKGIGIHTRTIGSLTTKLGEEKESLAQILRNTQQIDDYTLMEAVFSADNISDFFGDLDSYNAVQEALHSSFGEIRTTRSSTENARAGLEGQKTEQEILRSKLVLAQREVESKEAEKQKLLRETQGQEAMYRQVKTAHEATAAQIRAKLFPLRDTGGIQFGQAVEYAKAASAKTGVRPAMILAILSQESDLGKNVGNCYVKDLSTGDGVGKNTGTPFSGVMKAPRDTVPFERITKALGLDWSVTQISCPQPGGYGGAMGPTQFIPSTWEMYEGRLRSTLGVSAANPWNASHAIMATGLYLSDVGAAGGSYTAEHTAAARYYAGGNWASAGQGYANSVMGKAAAFQKDIDFLSSN